MKTIEVIIATLCDIQNAQKEIDKTQEALLELMKKFSKVMEMLQKEKMK